MSRRIFWLLVALLAAAVSLGAQYAPLSPEDLARSLILLPAKDAWLLTATVPDRIRFCAALDPDGTLHGCITAKDLRAKADAEGKSRKGE